MVFATYFIFSTVVLGIGFALYTAKEISKISIDNLYSEDDRQLQLQSIDEDDKLADDMSEDDKLDGLEHSDKDDIYDDDLKEVDVESGGKVKYSIAEISGFISEGAESFLRQEYIYMMVFIVIFSGVILLLIVPLRGWGQAFLTVIAFVAGSITSIVCGYIGMKIAVYSNSRTAVKAQFNIGPAFVTAFKAGSVMGFALVSAGLLILLLVIHFFAAVYEDAYIKQDVTRELYEAIAGYGLGGSSIALFGRVGGGIYTKAADVGADLVGKVVHGIPEDDPRNPAVIADNVGDNVGDIAGMGADLFGSFAESSCATMVIASQGTLFKDYTAMSLPLIITGCGIIVCFITSFFATHCWIVRSKSEVEPSLKRQLFISTFLMTPVVLIVCLLALPETFELPDLTDSDAETFVCKNWQVFFTITAGLWAGLIIGLVTEYYTSHSYKPVREVSESCKTGAATNVIYGLALGYQSVIIPCITLAVVVYVGFSLAGMFGIATGALGILSTLCTGLTIDAYGPICDNAGGLAEMCELGEEVRDRTDALDAAGNTTAAIGKGFAIGSAALVSLALFGAFVTTVKLPSVNVLEPIEFSGLLVGAMLPYWFSAMTMKSVGKAAMAMVNQVSEQLERYPEILEGKRKPDYAACVAISTKASLKEMIAPGCLVISTPIIVGYVFGVKCLAGLLAGTLVSGVQMAISSSNTGGAWDNAKKYIEAGALGEGHLKGSDTHKASVIGDTIGDPLKDTSGPALNILIKLMAIISLVFGPSFV